MDRHRKIEEHEEALWVLQEIFKPFILHV